MTGNLCRRRHQWQEGGGGKHNHRWSSQGSRPGRNTVSRGVLLRLKIRCVAQKLDTDGMWEADFGICLHGCVLWFFTGRDGL